MYVCFFFVAHGNENTVLSSMCFQPFPERVSSGTRRWCLIQPTLRAQLKTASLLWETVWPESSTQTCQQPLMHSSQGQPTYFVPVRNVALCETQSCQFLPVMQKSMSTVAYSYQVAHIQSYNLGMRKVNVGIALLASFCSF